MSVTKVAHSKRKRKDSSKWFNRPSTIVTTHRVKSMTKQEAIHGQTSWFFSFVICNGCYDFVPFVSAANSFNQPHNACANCGSHQIRYLSTSSGKLFGYLSKNI
jgi:hypothetical protein